METCYDCASARGYVRIATTNGDAWVCPKCAYERDVENQIEEAARFGDED